MGPSDPKACRLTYNAVAQIHMYMSTHIIRYTCWWSSCNMQSFDQQA